MDVLNDLILPFATSPWLYVIALGLVVLDGVFPVFPSEIVVVGLAALSASHATPSLLGLLLIAASGAMLGDMLTYGMGRLLGVRRLQATRLRPLARMLRWASRRMSGRAGTVILIARFIPFARLAVNLTAGSTHYGFWRFAPFCLVAGMVWAGYNVAMGALAGRWFADNPLLGMALAIGLAIVIGFALDFAASRLRRHKARV